MPQPNLISLEQVNLQHLSLVGGKNASLGEMLQNLTTQGIKVPTGFAITVEAYDAFIHHNKLDDRIKDLISQIDVNDIVSLRKTGLEIRQLIVNGFFPEDLKDEIIQAYQELSAKYDQESTDVAVRSSATAEDLPDASFAGQQDTYLNIRGAQSLLHAVRSCFASLFTDRAISYRETKGFDHFEVKLSVGVQKMVRSDLGASGVAFSLETESGFKDVVRINGAYGLGEMIVQGAISPDEFMVYKPKLEQGYKAIIEKKMGEKTQKMVYSSNPSELTKFIPVAEDEKQRFCIDNEQVIQLAQWVMAIEKYYTEKKGSWCPMDVEWAFDGLSKELYIVQARPETIHSQRSRNTITAFKVNGEVPAEKLITQGIAVGDTIGSGKVRVLHSLDKRDGGHDPQDFKEGEVLVTEMTDPDWEPLMKKASAIITNKGGRTCHAAIVARELGITAIVGSGNATEKLKNEQEVTVCCAEGDIGFVYEGQIAYEKEEIDLSTFPNPETPVMLNVAAPEMAFKFAHLPNAGVGLAREEFIINDYIQAHPLALLNHHKLEDQDLSDEIANMIRGYENEEDFFIHKLSYGIAKIGAAFSPNKVIVRFSDFKSNEYANLLGGKYYEPDEENPMIGWRGASRYYSESYEYAFGMECKAIKKVREEYGLDNVIVMIPFCRTVEECQKVLAVMEKYGLKRGENGLEVYLMAELPSNVIMAREFAEYIDGFSIGSNDLTQLTLGLDRDSSLVAHVYDERNPAVKRMIKSLIEVAKDTGTKVGICGQGPSDFPDFAQFLVEEGINTISVTPDSLLKTLKAIHNIEQTVKEKEVASLN